MKSTNRVNVYNDGPNHYGEYRKVVGWYTVKREWIDAGVDYRTDALALTAGGRWVRVTHSGYQDAQRSIWFASDEEVRQFLLLHRFDEKYEKYFGQIAPESSPS